MILYGSSISPFVRKVLAFAAEKGIALEVQRVGIGDPNPEFRTASPFGKMPALADGDFRLSDSSAIVHYLEAKIPDPPMIPSDPELRGKVVWFDEFADTILFDCGRKMFFNRVVAPLFLGRAGDEDAAARAEREELPPVLDYLERVVPERGFLVGDKVTLADVAVASPFVNFEHMATSIDEARYPRTRAYVGSMLERPSFASVVAKEREFMSRFAA